MSKLIIATTALLALASSTGAFANPSCNVNQSEWQPEQALRDKLAAQSWTVNTVKIDNGCYEVYGTDAGGKKVELYFDPQTLEAVPGQESDEG